MMSSPSITTNGWSPTCLRATDTAWPSPSGSPCRTKWMSASSANSTTSARSPVLPLACSWYSSSKLRSKWSSRVRLLRPVMMRMSSMPGRDRLFDHVLDRRLVDDRQHLLGLRLGGRQEPGPQTRRRNHRLGHFRHGSSHISVLSLACASEEWTSPPGSRTTQRTTQPRDWRSTPLAPVALAVEPGEC